MISGGLLCCSSFIFRKATIAYVICVRADIILLAHRLVAYCVSVSLSFDFVAPSPHHSNACSMASALDCISFVCFLCCCCWWNVQKWWWLQNGFHIFTNHNAYSRAAIHTHIRPFPPPSLRMRRIKWNITFLIFTYATYGSQPPTTGGHTRKPEYFEKKCSLRRPSLQFSRIFSLYFPFHASRSRAKTKSHNNLVNVKYSIILPASKQTMAHENWLKSVSLCSLWNGNRLSFSAIMELWRWYFAYHFRARISFISNRLIFLQCMVRTVQWTWVSCEQIVEFLHLEAFGHRTWIIHINPKVSNARILISAHLWLRLQAEHAIRANECI